MKHRNVREVGASDPEHRTSLVLDAVDEEFEPSVSEQGLQVCYYNDEEFSVGTYVSAGSVLLRCEKGGVWVRAGSSYE